MLLNGSYVPHHIVLLLHSLALEMSSRVAQRCLLIQLIQLCLINSFRTHSVSWLNNLQFHFIPAYSSKTSKPSKTSATLSFLATLGLAILLAFSVPAYFSSAILVRINSLRWIADAIVNIPAADLDGGHK